jgi:hypothetical protein
VARWMMVNQPFWTGTVEADVLAQVGLKSVKQVGGFTKRIFLGTLQRRFQLQYCGRAICKRGSVQVIAGHHSYVF